MTLTPRIPSGLDRLTSLLEALRAAPDTEAEMRAAIKTWNASGSQADLSAAMTAQAQHRDLVEPIDAHLADAYAGALATASHQGTLGPVRAGAQTVFEVYWSHLVDAGWGSLSISQKNELTRELAGILRRGTLSEAPDGGTARQVASTMLTYIELGILPEATGGELELCRNPSDGTLLRIRMADWAPVLFQRAADGAPQPPTPGTCGKAFHVEVNIPTGRLVASDMIRACGLAEALRNMRERIGFNLNHEWHRVLRTAVFAQTSGVVDVAMADDGPDLVQDPATGALYAATPDDAHPDIAAISHDYWGTMIMDRATLRARGIAEGMSEDAAEAAISDWLSSTPFAHEITVAPGTWHLYWDDDRESLARVLRAADIGAPKDARMVLSPTRLPLPDDAIQTLDAAALEKMTG